MHRLSDFSGIWKSSGYGWIVDISASDYRFYHETAHCLICAESGDATAFFASFDRFRCSADQLILFNRGDITEYSFERIPDPLPLPVYQAGENCDSQLNFDVLWQNFQDHYAFFELRGVDWQQVREEFSGRFDDDRGEDGGKETLWQAFSDILPRLNDGHVSLDGGDRAITCQLYPAERRGFQGAAGTPNRFISPRSTADAVHQGFEGLFLQPFNHTRTRLKSSCNELLHWCSLKPGIAYLNVLRLFGFADTADAAGANDIPHDRRSLGTFLHNDMTALDKALDEIFNDLQQARGLILDIRINGGGFDRAGKRIAERLAHRPLLAWQKQARCAGGFNPIQPQHLEPSTGPRFSGPVVALISPLCLSAGEIFALCLRALPQVTLAGGATAGMLSDNLNKPLPNGWELSLSNEVYLSHDGSCFEGVGVPPDVMLKTLDEQQCTDALHASLVSAVSLLEQKIAGQAEAT